MLEPREGTCRCQSTELLREAWGDGMRGWGWDNNARCGCCGNDIACLCSDRICSATVCSPKSTYIWSSNVAECFYIVSSLSVVFSHAYVSGTCLFSSWCFHVISCVAVVFCIKAQEVATVCFLVLLNRLVVLWFFLFTTIVAGERVFFRSICVFIFWPASTPLCQ